MPETTDLGSLIRAKLTPAEIDRLQHFDKAALLALDRAIIEVPMPEASRRNLRALIREALS